MTKPVALLWALRSSTLEHMLADAESIVRDPEASRSDRIEADTIASWVFIELLNRAQPSPVCRPTLRLVVSNECTES